MKTLKTDGNQLFISEIPTKTAKENLLRCVAMLRAEIESQDWLPTRGGVCGFAVTLYAESKEGK